MDDIILRFTTGEPEIDRILRGIVGVFEAAFPGRIHAYHIAGSYAEGTSTATSDLDLDVIFKANDEPPDEVNRSGQLLRHLAAICPVELNAGCTWENQFLAYHDAGDRWAVDGAIPRRVYLKLAKPVLYGEDIRERVYLPRVEDWGRWLLWDALWQVGRLHGDAWDLTYPLDHPDPPAPLYGYDRDHRRDRGGTERPSTRLLVRAVHQGASAVLALEGQRYVVRKHEVADAYREVIGDRCSETLAAIDRICRVECAYLVPGDARRQRRLREVCAQAPPLINRILLRLRECALQDLRRYTQRGQPATETDWDAGEIASWLVGLPPQELHALGAAARFPSAVRDGRRLFGAAACRAVWALRALRRVRFPHDPEVRAAVSSLLDCGADVIRRAAQETLGATQRTGATRP